MKGSIVPPPDQKKVVTSLLLYSVMSRQTYHSFKSRCDDIICSGRYSHEIPPRVETAAKYDNVKCSFDFSDQLSLGLIYYDAISEFLETHEQFICDVLSVDARIPVYLSALLTVDQNLAMFEVKSPKIPRAINAFCTFEFDYSVWHTLSSSDV